MEGLRKTREKEITCSFHFIKRWKTRDIEIEKVEETARTGRIVYSGGRKAILERYFGKENETYCVVCFYENDFIEVMTVWNRNGR